MLRLAVLAALVHADEELRLRESLEEERLALQIKFKDQLEVQIQEQRKKLSDEHRERVEALTLEVLQSHERQLKVERKKLILEQQEESETVLKELGEALRYGTETNLKKLRVLQAVMNQAVAWTCSPPRGMETCRGSIPLWLRFL